MGPLDSIRFVKTNGGMGRTAASEDQISGLIFGGMGLTFGSAEGSISGFEDVYTTLEGNHVGEASHCYWKVFKYAEQMADCGIVHTDYDGENVLSDIAKAKNVLYYHISEFFRMNPTGTLYVMINSGNFAFQEDELSLIQCIANGSIRQCGIFQTQVGQLGINSVKGYLNSLDYAGVPMSVVITSSGEVTEEYDPMNDWGLGVFQLPEGGLDESDLDGMSKLSLLIGCDFTTKLYNELGGWVYYGCIGACIGAISRASVHESIAWVQKFPLGFENPSLWCGASEAAMRMSMVFGDEYPFIYVCRYVGDSDCYFNDSRTLELPTSDYAYIENVRTIDKACRGIRKNLLPYLNSPLYVDPDTGKLQSNMVAFLETTAGKALEDMEKAGELSGYSVEINPEQNVLSTSEVEIIIKKVPVGVMRKVLVKIGYTTNL